MALLGCQFDNVAWLEGFHGGLIHNSTLTARNTKFRFTNGVELQHESKVYMEDCHFQTLCHCSMCHPSAPERLHDESKELISVASVQRGARLTIQNGSIEGYHQAFAVEYPGSKCWLIPVLR